jgi:Domain of unknown function (DUF4105)
MIASLAADLFGSPMQLLLALVGTLHAIAAFFYFSKARHSLVWALAWITLTLICAHLVRDNPVFGVSLFAAAVLLWTLWWATLRPNSARLWVADNAYQSTGTIAGDALTIHNLRNFDWHSRREITPRWETRHYDLGKLTRLDLLSCTWGSPHMAHMIVSFGFTNQPPLAFSIETRRETNETWSTLAGFFKAYELIIIAADERDVVRVRTNVRGEKVELYEILATPLVRRRLIEKYVDDMNALSLKPRFYHTIWTNCTTEIARLVRLTGQRVPLDWRILVSGYVPQFLYRAGMIATAQPFPETQRAADITASAKSANTAEDFSRQIRKREAV